MNITRLKCWTELKNLGFIEIRFRSYGKIASIGCALQKKHTNLSGKDFFSDIICIEPAVYRFSDSKNYHISGKVKTPYQDKFYRYEFGRKIEFYEMVETINNYFPANRIMDVVHLMLV
jgi:hypothetical protein